MKKTGAARAFSYRVGSTTRAWSWPTFARDSRISVTIMLFSSDDNAFGFAAADDGEEVRDRVVLVCWPFRRSDRVLGFLRQRHAQPATTGRGDGNAVIAVDLEVLAIERPVPRCLDDADRRRILEQHGRFVVNLRIDVGLKALRDRGDRGRAVIVHQPGHQVGTVAAEIEERAGAVLDRIGQPLEELLLHVDLLRALVAVHRDHLADVASGVLLLEERPDRGMIRVPRRLVVDEDLDVAALGRLLDASRVGGADRQRLLHHHRNMPRGRCFDDHRMIERAGERRDRLRRRVFDHRLEIGEEEAVGQVVQLRVFLLERYVRLEDADDLHVLAAPARHAGIR